MAVAITVNMSTMLVFLFTDAALSPSAAQALMNRHLGETFNSITVDGDTSTSDTLLLFATGQSGAALIEDADDPRLSEFSSALREAMADPWFSERGVTRARIEFDLGQICTATGRTDLARAHFETARAIATAQNASNWLTKIDAATAPLEKGG